MAERPEALPPESERSLWVSPLPLFETRYSDPMKLGLWGVAFEKACQTLRKRDRLTAKDVIGKRIVALAQEGERDPDRLCTRALAAIGVKPD
jgi:hypothetical protein